MLQGLYNILSLLATGNQAQDSLDPLYDAITELGPWALSIVVGAGALYGIIVGVKFAKAEDSAERQKMQKALINGIIGFVAIFVLIAILYAIRGPLVEFMNS